MGLNDRYYRARDTLLPTLSLFGSLGTLVCCALPALMVSLGAGAALAGLVSTAPWLVALSTYKAWTFGISGALIAASGMALWHARTMACPTDPAKARACRQLRRISVWIYGSSIALWCLGFFFAFVAVHIFY